MKHFLLISLCLLTSLAAFAQLPPGSTAPNWTMTDINGTSHTLYNYLDNEKVVFLDFSATWCGPCWNYHNTHAFKDLYNMYGPPGSNKVMAFMIEGDEDTNTACLYGPTGCVGGTQGNWVSGTPYPIIDDHTMVSAYGIGYYPTIYGVCPDKKIYEVGQVPEQQLWDFAKGCSAPTVQLVSSTNNDCFGQSNGSITVTAVGGITPFSYAWSNGASTQNLSNLPAGNYTLTVTGSLGGTKSFGPITITQPQNPVEANLSSFTPAGCGGLGGTATVIASGGTPGYNYLWNTGATTQQVFNLAPGAYSVTVTDLNGCTDNIQNIVIEPPVLPTASASAPGLLTCSQPMITLNGSGSTTGPDIDYTWTTSDGHIVSGGNTLDNCVVDAPGTYSLLVLNSASTCSAWASVAVSQDISAPTATAATPGELTCTTTQLTLVGLGSSGPGYSILWTTVGGNIVSGATTLNPVVNAAGTYTLTITKTANGCTGSSNTVVTSNTTPPNISASGGEITCTSSSVQLAGNSTTNGVTYSWTGPNGFTSSQQNPTVSQQGAYTLKVTQTSSGCSTTAQAQVLENNAPPAISAAGGTINCLQSSVALTGNSNAVGSTYSWTGPNGFTSSLQSPSVNEQGNYLLTVTAPNGCTKDATAVVNVNTTPPTANAGSNGVMNCHVNSIVLNGTGSSSGSQFSYLWTTTNGHLLSGENTLTPTVDAIGDYALLVTNNNNGCTQAAATAVTQTPAVTAGLSSQTNISCFGNANGTATVQAGGGNGSYTYAWSNGQSNATASNLSAGSYSVTVTDGENCTASQTVAISQPNELVVTTSTTAQTAPGVNDGTASANITGGTGSYTYAWSNGATNDLITGLAPGNYTVSVTDANGCVKIKTVTVNAFGCAVSAATSETDVTCNGAANGTAGISLSNALEPYTYAWSNGETTANITGLVPGTYTVSATDDNGCEVVASIEVEEPAVLNANVTSTAVTASGAGDGTATANPTGGTAPFSYEWSTGATTATITGLVSANYMVTVSDANGCTVEHVVPVAPFACTAAANIAFNNISCHGESDGSATVTFGGGLSPYNYEWSNEATTATISLLGPGTYSVTVSDAVNCAAIAEVTIEEPNSLEAEVVALTNADCGQSNGFAEVAAVGGTPGFAFQWSNGETGTTVNNLDPGVLTVAITDANDCQTSLEIQVGVNDTEAPEVLTQDITIVLDANGNADIAATDVDFGSSDNCDIASMTIDRNSFTCADLGQHEVVLTVTDEAGNSSTGSAIVTVEDNAIPSIIVQDIIVALDENGEAVITPAMLDNGSTDNCGIVDWGIDASSFTCDNIGANAVVLTVTDGSGNSNSGTAIVTVQDTKSPAIDCPSDMVLPYCDAVATYSYAVSDNCTASPVVSIMGPASGTSLSPGVSTVEISATDAHGNSSTCSFTISVTETIEANPAVADVSCFGGNDGSISINAMGGSPAYTYAWNNGATSPAIENIGSGDYSVVVTDADGCEATLTFAVLQPTDIVSDAITIVPATGDLPNGSIDVGVSGGTGPYQYVWTNEAGNVVSGNEDIEDVPAGTYKLTVTDANGCVDVHVFTVESATAVIDQNIASHINLYPNPTTGMVTLEVSGTSGNNVTAVIYNVNGKMLAEFPNGVLANGKRELDLSAYPAGVYLVKILIEGQIVSKRLVVGR